MDLMGSSEYRPGYYLPAGHKEAEKLNDNELLKDFSPDEDVGVTMDNLMNGPIEVRMAVLRWREKYEPKIKKTEFASAYSGLEILLADYPQDQGSPDFSLFWFN